MAHVEKRAQGRWRARHLGPDGRERSKTFDRRADAERFLTGIEHSKLVGSYTIQTTAVSRSPSTRRSG